MKKAAMFFLSLWVNVIVCSIYINTTMETPTNQVVNEVIIEMTEAMETMGEMIVTNNIIRREHESRITTLETEVGFLIHDMEVHKHEDY